MTPQCPGRGPGLGHIATGGVCEYCGIPSSQFYAVDQALRSTQAAEHAAQIRGMIEAPKDLDGPVEPKMSTGEVIGPLWGKGRGEITPRQVTHLEFILYLEQRGIVGS